jgi:hypothetical protein
VHVHHPPVVDTHTIVFVNYYFIEILIIDTVDFYVMFDHLYYLKY